jgi:hypothetical protein
MITAADALLWSSVKQMLKYVTDTPFWNGMIFLAFHKYTA